MRPFEGLSVAVDGRPEARGEEAASSLSGEHRSLGGRFEEVHCALVAEVFGLDDLDSPVPITPALPAEGGGAAIPDANANAPVIEGFKDRDGVRSPAIGKVVDRYGARLGDESGHEDRSD
ncbi:MAG: hypothetical protein CML16_00525 [Pusillimonas sp.]|nr:hypothetical protein [Pusillimonas sp.]